MQSTARGITACNCFVGLFMIFTIALGVLNISAGAFGVWLVLLCLCSIPCVAVTETIGIVFSCIVLKRERKFIYLILNLITLAIILVISIYIFSTIQVIGDGM